MGQGSYLFYYIFPIVICIIAFVGYKKPKTGFLIMLILLFFSMFRGDNVGNDTKNYMDTNRIQYRGGNLEVEFNKDYLLENFGNKTELIDIALNRIVYGFNLPPRVIIWCYALINILVLYRSLRKLKVNTSIGLLIYVLLGYYYFSLSAARQMAAVSIVLYAFTFMIQNDGEESYKILSLKSNFVKFVLFVGIASMIHASAIFFIVVYPLRYLHINKSLIVMLLCTCCAICIIFSIDPMSYIYSFFNFDYITRYMGLYDETGRSLMGKLNDIIKSSIFIYFFIIGTKEKTCVFDNIYALAIILMLLFVQNSGLLSRITYYITIFISVYLSKVLIENKDVDKKTIISFVIYVVLSIYSIGGYGTALTSGYYLMAF